MSSLALVIWSADGQQFALEACHIRTLQPYTTDMDCQGLHQLIPGLQAEPPVFCLGWHVAGQTCWLATHDEPRHVQLPLDALWPLPAALQQARQHAAIRALGWHQNRPVTVLDAPALSGRAQ